MPADDPRVICSYATELDAISAQLKDLAQKMEMGVMPYSPLMDEILSTDFWDLDIGCRCRNVFLRERIETVADLVQYTPRDLLRLRDFGKVSLEEIRRFLLARGLSLGMTLPEKFRKSTTPGDGKC